LDLSETLFREITIQSPSRLSVWNAMISAYGQHRRGKEALQVFRQMLSQKVDPSDSTLVSVFSACSECGMVEEALDIYRSMPQQVSVKPHEQHKVCVVDVLGQAGRFEEAERFIGQELEDKGESSVRSWETLLEAAKKRNDDKRAESIAERILKLKSQDKASPNGATEKAAEGQQQQKDNNPKQTEEAAIEDPAGRSRVPPEATFINASQDAKLPIDLYKAIEQIRARVIEAGYTPDPIALTDPDYARNAEKLWRHSERQAIAFGLLCTPPGTPLTLANNIRICPDCHAVIKYISRIYQRPIAVRDLNRWHHFTPDAKCSCADYWLILT